MSLLLGAALALAGPPLAAQAPPGAPTVTRGPETYQDWMLSCEKPAGSEREQCFIFQNLVLKKDKQRLLNFAVARLAADGQPAALFTFPLGISLSAGAAIKIDDGEAIPLTFERCQVNGCVAPLRLDDALIARLRAGLEARVAFRDASRREIVVPVSLRGFTAALAALP